MTLAADPIRVSRRRGRSTDDQPGDVTHWLDRSSASVAAECDEVRRANGLPDRILFAILDDMGPITTGAIQASCSTRRTFGFPRCGECAYCEELAS